MPKHHNLFATLACSLVLLLPQAVIAAKTDVVKLLNGDAITGEIKELEFGSLSYSTDSMGTVRIDWEDVVNVSSNQALQIEITDGTRYFGAFLPAADQHRVIVKTASSEIILRHDQIVRITPIETGNRFVERLEGSVSLGISAQKSAASTSNLSADVGYRTRAYVVGVRLNSSLTRPPSDSQDPATSWQKLELNYKRLRASRWFTDWFTSYEENDTTLIDSRVSAGGALGRYLIQNNTNQLSLTAGLQGTRTVPLGTDPTETQAESRFEISFQRRVLQHDSRLKLTSKIFVPLEEPSEFRAETDLTYRRDVIEDLFIDLTLRHSYYREPQTDGDSTDYTSSINLGYSF